MKKKILLCVFSFMMVTLFSCGLIFLPLNTQTSQQTIEVGQEQTQAVSGNWDDYASTNGFSVSGTTIRISTATGLAYFSKNIATYANYTVYQDGNIDLSAHYWTPIGYINGDDRVDFTGTYNGQGYGIFGLYSRTDISVGGFFGYINGATLNGIIIRSGEISPSGTGTAGGICAYGDGGFTISNCANYANINSRCVGGILGGMMIVLGLNESDYDACQIYDCYNRGNLTSSSSTSWASYVHMGGIAGNVRRVYNPDTNQMGAINIYRCYNTGNISYTGTATNNVIIGGILGYQSMGSISIYCCFNLGSVTCSSTVSNQTDINAVVGRISPSETNISGLPYIAAIGTTYWGANCTQTYVANNTTGDIRITQNDNCRQISGFDAAAKLSSTFLSGRYFTINGTQYGWGLLDANRWTYKNNWEMSSYYNDGYLYLTIDKNDQSTLSVDANGGTYNGTSSISTYTQNIGTTRSIYSPSKTGHSLGAWVLDGGGSISTFGKLHSKSADPFFMDGTNSTYVYNNASNGTVTHQYIASSNVDIELPSGARILRITNTGSASPGLGGFTNHLGTRANAVFYTIIYAKIPVGYSISSAENAYGGGTKTWLTSQAGTGDWQVYIHRYNCGSSGSFSSVNYYYLSGTAGTTSNPVVWEVAYFGTYDATGLSASGSSTSSLTYTYDDSNNSLVALWNINSYTLTVNPNGGTWNGSSSSQTFTQKYNTTKSIPNPDAREGYTFKSWSKSGSGSLSGTTFTFGAGNTTLTAQWTPNTYSVKFYRNHSASDTTTSTQSGFTYDQSKALQANPWTKTGYTFKGWSTSRSATTATYTNGQSVKNLTSTNGGTVNLYAVWALNSYTLTIDPNGGTYNGKTGSQAVSGLYTQNTTIAAPTRYGYNFAGWAISGGNGSLSTFGKVCSASTDPLFTTSNNNVGIYNNSGDKSVTHTLISASSAGLSNWISGGRVLRVTYTGSCTWGNGLVQSISTSANKVFYTMIYAKVPVGYTLEPAYNASGDGATRTWITSNQGTGNWQTYVMRWNCGSSGTFSNIGYWYIQGNAGSASNPVNLDIAYLCSFDATGLSSTTGVATSPFVYTYGTSDVTLFALWEETWLNHTTPFSGSGTEADPYIISSAENLAYLSKRVYDGFSTFDNQYFKQTADIDLTKYNWQPIGVEINRSGSSVYCYFSGIYDGNGYTISGLHTPKGSGSLYLAQGLFGMVLVRNTTEIRNVTLDNVDVRGGDCVGGLAGWVLSIYDNETVTIENCSVNGKTYGDDSVGGLIGKIETRERGIVEVINCDSDVSVGSLQEDIGGIVGNVENEDGIGKIVISLCNNYGDVVTNSGTYVGGIVGCFENTSSTTACLTLDQNANFGQIQGMQDVGGIIGSARDIANITNNSNMGNVSIIGGKDSAAGIAGYFYSGTMTGNTSFGDITGINYVGGLVGYLQTAIMSSNQVEGTIKGNNYIGGLVGYVAGSSASATDCAVNADVIASSATDNNGLFGRLANSFGITNCYFIGNFKNSSGTALSMTSFTGGGISPIVTNSYIIANGNAPVKKYTSLSSFKESWTIVSGVNDNNPIQKELFYLAGYTGGDEMLRVWLEDRNILSDPSFEYGNWSAQIGTSELSTEHARSGQHSWKMTEVGASYGETYSRTITAYQIDPTHKYFVRMYAYQEVQHGGIQAYWQDKEPSIGSTTLGPAGQWNMYGWRFDRVGFSGSQFFRIDFEHHNQVGELWVDDVLLIDLTAMYGAGNEPSQEECMRLFA